MVYFYLVYCFFIGDFMSCPYLLFTATHLHLFNVLFFFVLHFFILLLFIFYVNFFNFIKIFIRFVSSVV